MVAREQLHQLIDQLPETHLRDAETALLRLRHADDSLSRFLANAPDDDEPSAPEEDAEAAESWVQHLRGETISAAEIKRTLLP